MPRPESLRLETERFELHDITPEDLEDLCGVFESNADFLALRDNLAAPSGGYDPASVRQYCEGAMLDALRHVLVVTDKESTTTVGLVDFVDESPADGVPWIGLVIIHQSYQRAGAGTSVVQTIAVHLASLGHSVVRMAVMEANDVGLRFVRRMGCEEYASASVPTTGGTGEAVLFELALPLLNSS